MIIKNEIKIAREKAFLGERLTKKDALALYEDNDLLSLGEWAQNMKLKKSDRKVFYIVNRHINLTNICSSNCPLCAFSCKSDDFSGYTLEINDIEKIVNDIKSVKNLSEIHIVSALHPNKPFEYYVEIVKFIKKSLSNISIRAFTPVEIVNFSKQSAKSIEEVLKILSIAGLNSLLGGGAEIFSERVRKIICPKKATGDEWLNVMRTAHKLGIKSNASIMYGHIETIEERIDHLIKLRELQDETGGFQAFLMFPFHPANTELGKKYNLERVSSWEDLKMISLSRLILDNFDHIKAFWVMLTLPIAQLALNFGADDLDGTIGEEKIIHSAGSKENSGITCKKLNKIIIEAGYEPVECDSFYNYKG
ncbi:MAG: CofH family radical SAM protein [Selenomonadaceae bacterium]|nr:CofH family radical SAM protein [Selenomonadaceae bacterium]